ncbi:MAG: peptide deformylase [Methylococcaceae bacterium]|nr:peptide deformylase [Methylococcaceae bacterium]MDZ4155256.1 peptide deformylase [Methylococcales bacterium]MDP2393472.1 peptide deformylase [Methylococcaceae bacterium]MDP3021342.1 peptide deformylase [Methylococcaceae bacterium]MDP3391067.1 peptide deformylase [Methylococcaceae bacterium]
MIYDIAQLGAKVLRQTATSVEDVGSIDTSQLIEDLRSTLASTQGVGLAAPQIGISKQLIVVASRPTPRYPNAPFMEPTIMINPRLTNRSDVKEKDWEGCLSIPGIRALVPRYKKISVQYINVQGLYVELELDGFIARVFQHEYDHLIGKVFLDRVESNTDVFSEAEYLKLIAAAV